MQKNARRWWINTIATEIINNRETEHRFILGETKQISIIDKFGIYRIKIMVIFDNWFSYDWKDSAKQCAEVLQKPSMGD